MDEEGRGLRGTEEVEIWKNERLDPETWGGGGGGSFFRLRPDLNVSAEEERWRWEVKTGRQARTDGRR